MFSLKQTNLKIFDEFNQGKFTVYKTHRVFSGSAIGHAREQANAVVKGDGGTIGILINLLWNDGLYLAQKLEVSQFVNQY